MSGFRRSIFDLKQIQLREWLVAKRHESGLSQRELAEKLQVVHSLVGKVETGERRLDVIEFIEYCNAMNADPGELMQLKDMQGL